MTILSGSLQRIIKNIKGLQTIIGVSHCFCFDFTHSLDIQIFKMDDKTPERQMNINLQQITPETPVNHLQGGFHHLGGYLDSPNANLLIPSSLFRPWDTPESLSPTSSNVPSLSPTSSNLASSETSSPPQLSPLSSLPSSPEDLPSSEISPSQAVYSSNGTCLFKIEPLESVHKEELTKN